MSDLTAARIRAERKARQWQTADLAARCAELGDDHLTENVIENIESGRRQAGRRRRAITIDEVYALARALDMPVQYLLPDLPPPGSLGPLSVDQLEGVITGLQATKSFLEWQGQQAEQAGHEGGEE